MFYSWSNANKITTKSLQIQYTGVYHKTYWGLPVYEFHRIATKEYQYVGMTEAAAKACQDAKLQQYTRTFVQWNNENGNARFMRRFICVADVSMDSDGDGLWTVSISVNEDQVQYDRYSFSPDAIPYNMFDTSLDYDEEPAEGGYLRISSIWRENQRLYIQYQQSISGFDRAQLEVQNSTDGGATWVNLIPTSSTDGQMYFNSGAWNPGLVRLKFGDTIFSNAEQTPTTSYNNTIDLYAPYWQVVGGSYGAWRVQFFQSFPDFDKNELLVYSKPSPQDAWTDITVSCDVAGDRITTPYTEQETLFYMRVNYNGHNSNTVNNMSHFLVVNSELSVVTENNQIEDTTISYHSTLANYDQTKVTVRYNDAIQTRTFNNNEITFTQDEDGNCTATVRPGNQIVVSPETVNATLIYNGVDVATASKKVYRT